MHAIKVTFSLYYEASPIDTKTNVHVLKSIQMLDDDKFFGIPADGTSRCKTASRIGKKPDT